MATKNIQVELLENSAFIEIEAEETMELKVVVEKLKSLGHLLSDKDYYIKNPDGTSVWDGNAIRSCKENKLILTTEKSWKPELVFSGGFSNTEEVRGKMVLNSETYWIIPFLDKALWNDFGGWAHLFLLENIVLSDGNAINIKALIQCSALNIQLANSVNNTQRTNKMLKVLENVILNRLSSEPLTINNIHEKIDQLSGKMQYYLTSHTETVWGVKIDVVLILGIEINI